MIVYAVIARFEDSIVLAETTVAGVEGNIPIVTLMLLQALRQANAIPDGARRTFVHRGDPEMQFCGGFGGLAPQWTSWFAEDANGCGNNPVEEYYYHLAKEGGVVYMSLTEEAGRPATNYAFLEEVREAFTDKYSQTQIKKSKAFGMDKSFSNKLASFIHHYNTNPQAGSKSQYSVAALNAQIQDLKNVMGENIHLMLKRGENIDALVDQTEELENDTKVFQKNGTTLKRTQKRKSCKYTMFIAMAFVLMVVFVVLIVLGIQHRR